MHCTLSSTSVELELFLPPILDNFLTKLSLQVYACRQSMPGHAEDHTLSTVHQIMEAWLEVAHGLIQNVEENVKAGNSEGAAKSCWIVERVWKLLISTMDLLQIMDPDDFMRLKEELAISQDGAAVSTEHIGGGKAVKLPLLCHILNEMIYIVSFESLDEHVKGFSSI